MRPPLDPTPYPKDSRSRPLDTDVPDGTYVYVQDQSGIIHVLPDGPHLNPKILGGAQPVRYAGDLTVANGRITDVTNLTGTFQCDEESGLIAVANELRRLGFEVDSGAVRFFPTDGSPPRVLE